MNDQCQAPTLTSDLTLDEVLADNGWEGRSDRREIDRRANRRRRIVRLG